MLPIPFGNPSTYPGHSGVDFPQSSGTRIPASGNGTVTFRGWLNDRAGYSTIVRYDGGPTVLYAHQPNVNAIPGVGSRVSLGSTIGAVDSTGNSTGPHLHMEIAEGSGAHQGTLAYVGSAVRWTATSSSWCEPRLDAAGVVSGAEYRLMVRARASKTLNVDLRIRAGASTAVTLGTEWVWAETTGAAGTGSTAQSGFSLTPTSGHSSGDWVEVDRVLLAVGDDAGEWYAGGTYDEPLRRTRWLGPANESASVLEVIGSV